MGGSAGCNGILGIERATLESDAGGSDADAGDGGADEDAPGVVAPPPDPLTCENYCTVIMQNCTDSNREYLSPAVCLKLCGYIIQTDLTNPYYPYPGPTPDNRDSLGCRLWHAHSAKNDPATHCRHAGPLGADQCGGPCEPFCNLDWRYCDDDNQIHVYAGQVTGCESVCDGGLPYDEGDSGDLVDTTHNTLNCRLWHLETAIDEGDPTTHCPHTGEQSATCQ